MEFEQRVYLTDLSCDNVTVIGVADFYFEYNDNCEIDYYEFKVVSISKIKARGYEFGIHTMCEEFKKRLEQSLYISYLKYHKLYCEKHDDVIKYEYEDRILNEIRN